MRSFLLCSVAIMILFIDCCYSQKENNNWYFGDKAGITFNTSDGDPVALSDGKIQTVEGTASASDKDGNLLFYTDGMTVWNKNHQIMPNGTKLLGNYSSSNSALIIPNPAYNNIYYVFTADNAEKLINDNHNRGINYSIVDLNKDNGLGDITQKNINLYESSWEKLAAVKNEITNSIWVISHEYNTNRFFAHEVTKNGVNHSAVISEIGIVHTGHAHLATGRLAISSDGTKLAVPIANYEGNMGYLEIFDFDPNTGIVSNPQDLKLNKPSYSSVFSEDGTKLYVKVNDEIYQYETNFCTIDKIIASRVTIAMDTIGAMERGPNNKIYLIFKSKNYLGEISNPNLKGSACNYIHNAVDLGQGVGILGLPTFLQSFYKGEDVKIICDYINTCIGENAIFKADGIPSATVYEWYSPDGNYLYTGQEFVLENTEATDAGEYKCIIKNGDEIIDTRYFVLYVNAKPDANIITDKDYILACGKDTVKLKAFPEQNNFSYLWSTGETSQSIEVTEVGDYWVAVTNETECTDTAKITIEIDPEFENVKIEIKNSKNNNHFCTGDSLVLSASSEYDEYLWSTGETTPSIVIHQQGKYHLAVKDQNGCESSDSIDIFEEPFYIQFEDIIFENICSGSSNTISSEILDLGPIPEPKVISNTYLKSGAFFEFLHSNAFDFYLQESSPFEYEINFSPTVAGIFYDTLLVEFTYPCITTRAIPIKGETILSSEITMSINDTLANTGEDYCIPIYTSSECSGLFDSLIFTIEYHPDLFHLTELSEGNILSETYSGDKIKVKILVENIKLNDEKSLLTELCGKVLLSERDYTEISISEIDAGNNIETHSQAGTLFASEVCAEDNMKFVFGEIPEISINPHPSRDGIINIAASKESKGNFTVTIFNSIGEKVFSGIWEITGNDANQYSIDSGKLSTGIYYLMINSGTYILHRNKIMIAK